VSDIRFKVAAMAAVATVVLLSVVSALGFVALVDATRRSQVEQLEQRLDDLERQLASTDDEVTSRLRLDLSLRVIRRGEMPPQPQVGTLQVVRTIDDPEIVALVGRVSTQQIDQTLATVRTALWVSVLVIGFLVGGAAWLAVDRSLAPVRSLTAGARAIEADPSAELLAVTSSGDEIAILAATFNDLLTKLRLADADRRRFVSDASHELRTPLMVLSADAEYALEHGDGAPETDELARSVLRQSDRLRTLVDDLLTLASLDEGSGSGSGGGGTVAIETMTPITVAEVLAAAGAETLTHQVPGDILDTTVPDVSRSLSNVVANAKRHTSTVVAVGVMADGETVTITVDDDGPGIAPGERSAIFERFYRPDNSRTRKGGGGAGLGLAIARTELASAGGTIAVGDSPIGGARFTITVPRVAMDAED